MENLPQMVEAYVASWIEIEPNLRKLSSSTVEAYVASWIEIIVAPGFPVPLASRLT